MNIWFITVGEPLPTDEGNNRLLRTGILASLLVEKNHSVVWWSSTFNHTQKKHRFLKNKCIQIKDNFKLILLHSIAYQSNVSLQRLINHYGIAKQFKKLAKLESKPDIILCSLPTLELSLEATEYGKKYNIPVILDIRDLWPDIFADLLPKYMQGVVNIIFFPLFNMLKRACKQANAITGITTEYVDWAIKYSQREKTNFDKNFPMGYSFMTPPLDEIKKAQSFWDKYHFKKTDFIICYFGVFSSFREIETVIEAANLLNLDHYNDIKFVFCGSGERFEIYKTLASNNQSIIFPGWVGTAEIWQLMRISTIGITPYPSIENYTKNIPNKPIEYLSAGLPIVSSLKGVLKNLLDDYNCGITYDNGNSKQLVEIILDLYKNPSQLKIMSDHAKKLFEEKFVAEKVYSNMIQYLEEIALCK
jgi:glycosyltransferase involved in cell wall biosynthesis